MNRATIVDHLERAERHVFEGDRHLRRQRDIIVWLRDAGYQTAEAEGLLNLFEDTQRLHLADRDRLRRELNDYDATIDVTGPRPT